ncbi:putative diguanylate cyclase YdaM [Tepidimonas thermarum]|uniref:diguanylate cyclase n=1 Tax=Tepidimonas thermarum TaxID=335431 RepID=A0A554WZP9_9BURK|nr:GGDEF domain-containing protein [Tepidimonas thermarum]TSE29070.1 putative diguanylate cyclase YdaM [Tepidimonas thermarum]
MGQVLEHLEQLARLTRGRDRDSMDATLVEVLLPLLDARCVVLWEAVPEDAGERLLTRARLERGMTVPQSSPPWVSLSDLPRVDDDPVRVQAWLARQTRVVADGAMHRVLVPLITESDRRLLIEAVLERAPDVHAVRVVEGVARIFENFINLLESSERDTLTGLLNRKSFDDTFYKITRRTPVLPDADGGQRQGQEAAQHWLGVVDVDHFKSVNDRFGHLIGDEVLLLMARILRSTFRHDDRLYRFGGEEFVVLVRAADSAAAAGVFERLRRNVEQYPFPQVGRITVSVGYTAVREHDTPSDAFERADRAVYLAKAEGRNTVRCYETHVQLGEPTPQRGSDGDIELF